MIFAAFCNKLFRIETGHLLNGVCITVTDNTEKIRIPQSQYHKNSTTIALTIQEVEIDLKLC